MSPLSYLRIEVEGCDWRAYTDIERDPDGAPGVIQARRMLHCLDLRTGKKLCEDMAPELVKRHRTMGALQFCWECDERWRERHREAMDV